MLNNIGLSYARDRVFLDLRAEIKIKVAVSRNGYVALLDPKMH